jgi:hypothetical protein
MVWITRKNKSTPLIYGLINLKRNKTMKNIHLLPTDKASRLWLDSDNKLWIHEIPTTLFMMQNIYITSDEEIKEGDWGLDLCEDLGLKYQPFKVDRATLKYANQECKKIILTTDPTLIADGVQSIDDEFLQWFVKNPSCEKVETICGLFNPMGRQVDPNNLGQNHSQCIWKHKIIIPQEEPKQHLEFINSNIEEFEGKLKEFKQEQKQYLIDIMRGDEELGLYNELYNEPKQETLEEAAENNYPEGDVWTIEQALIRRLAFINGAKEQAKRMYSEEEVRKLLETQRGNCYVAILTKTKDKELAAIAGGAPEPSGYNGWVK